MDKVLISWESTSDKGVRPGEGLTAAPAAVTKNITAELYICFLVGVPKTCYNSPDHKLHYASTHNIDSWHMIYYNINFQVIFDENKCWPPSQHQHCKHIRPFIKTKLKKSAVNSVNCLEKFSFSNYMQYDYWFKHIWLFSNMYQ